MSDFFSLFWQFQQNLQILQFGQLTNFFPKLSTIIKYQNYLCNSLIANSKCFTKFFVSQFRKVFEFFHNFSCCKISSMRQVRAQQSKSFFRLQIKDADKENSFANFLFCKRLKRWILLESSEQWKIDHHHIKFAQKLFPLEFSERQEKRFDFRFFTFTTWVIKF